MTNWADAQRLQLYDRPFSSLTTDQLLRILRLRIDVFVVEQSCAYPEIDAGDNASSTRHLWLESTDGQIACYLRILREPVGYRIGRVATVPVFRNKGYARDLLRIAIERTTGPWVLDAQAHLESWYSTQGFSRDGSDFDDYGILHVPMRRASG